MDPVQQAIENSLQQERQHRSTFYGGAPKKGRVLQWRENRSLVRIIGKIHIPG